MSSISIGKYRQYLCVLISSPPGMTKYLAVLFFLVYIHVTNLDPLPSGHDPGKLKKIIDNFLDQNCFTVPKMTFKALM